MKQPSSLKSSTKRVHFSHFQFPHVSNQSSGLRVAVPKLEEVQKEQCQCTNFLISLNVALQTLNNAIHLQRSGLSAAAMFVSASFPLISRPSVPTAAGGVPQRHILKLETSRARQKYWLLQLQSQPCGCESRQVAKTKWQKKYLASFAVCSYSKD